MLDNISDLNLDELLEEPKEIKIEDLLHTRIAYKTKSMDIETILNSLKRGDYVLPKYQRKFVWEKNQASNLILSLIKNIPIPPIYLYYNISDGKYVILDGQQRITTLFMYYKNIFYKGKKDRKRIDFSDISQKLQHIDLLEERFENHQIDEKSLNEEKRNIYKYIDETYNIVKSKFELGTKDITFDNFEEKSRRVLMRKDLDIVFVQCDDENPHKVYTEIFKLLNSAGKELSTQEIRNGVYSDNFLYDYIDKLNENNATWRKIYGNSLVAKDFEYLLRFLALDRFTKYDGGDVVITESKNFSLANIIDKYSEIFNRVYLNKKKNEYTPEQVEQKNKKLEIEAKKEAEKLEKFFAKISDIKDKEKVCGGKILIIEAIFIAFSKLDLLDKDIDIKYFDLIEKLDLRNDFKIDSSTSNKANVEKRILKAIEIVKSRYGV